MTAHELKTAATQPSITPAPLGCSNTDQHHGRYVKAIAKLSYPDGRYLSTTGCVGCMTWAVRNALDEDRPIVVEPVTDWEIEDPTRASIVLNRLKSRIETINGSEP